MILDQPRPRLDRLPNTTPAGCSRSTVRTPGSAIFSRPEVDLTQLISAVVVSTSWMHGPGNRFGAFTGGTPLAASIHTTSNLRSIAPPSPLLTTPLGLLHTPQA